MTLHTKILDAARDEVAKKNNFNTWEDYIDDLNEYANRALRIEDAGEEAALLAMEKQDEFRDWAARLGWEVAWFTANNERFYINKSQDKHLSPEQLYEIWEGQK